MAALTTREILKYEWRVELFLRKYKEGEEFEMNDGTKKKFVYNDGLYKAVKSRIASNINKYKLLDVSGKEHPIGALAKSAEFGGKGAGFSTRDEDRELASLRKQIEEAKAEQASGEIEVWDGKKRCKVADAVSTPGTPKSDFHLVDQNGKEVLWISHKDGRRPQDMQQWGGISKSKEPDIFRHPETQRFINDLKALYPDGLPRATSIYRKIEDEKLKKMSMYGNQFGRALDRQNVSVMLQGPVELKKKGFFYILGSNIKHYNGDTVTGSLFEPVFAAIYKGDRSDAGVKGTRIVIMPIGGRKFKFEI